MYTVSDTKYRYLQTFFPIFLPFSLPSQILFMLIYNAL